MGQADDVAHLAAALRLHRAHLIAEHLLIKPVQQPFAFHAPAGDAGGRAAQQAAQQPAPAQSLLPIPGIIAGRKENLLKNHGIEIRRRARRRLRNRTPHLPSHPLHPDSSDLDFITPMIFAPHRAETDEHSVPRLFAPSQRWSASAPTLVADVIILPPFQMLRLVAPPAVAIEG
ncbi:hypothetical protein [Xanthobacter variabilis]|uniref:hypothetical protein n=1 Tax=Xanthobacter variabilis TaxID=3119932 RepID=UPI00374F6398